MPSAAAGNTLFLRSAYAGGRAFRYDGIE